MEPVIIGCGNLDRGDDAAGLLVAQRLRELGVEALELSGEGLSLIETWSGADEVILIDAVVTGSPPGKITIWDARQRGLVGDFFRCSTHAFGVAEAVELARILDRLPGRLLIYGIEGARFEMGSRPQPAVLKAVEQVAQEIVHEVALCTSLP